MEMTVLISADLSILLKDKMSEQYTFTKIASLRHFVPEFRKVKNKNRNIFIYFLNGGKIRCALHKNFSSVFIYYQDSFLHKQNDKHLCQIFINSQGFFFSSLFKLFIDMGRLN